jgi:hypothetical protein
LGFLVFFFFFSVSSKYDSAAGIIFYCSLSLGEQSMLR